MKPLLALAATFLALPALAQDAEKPATEPPTPASVIAAAAPREWIAIAREDLLVMDLAPDTRGKARRVVIQLMPPPFSQPWVANVRTLAAVHWWDGTSVNRVQDNYVTQWGDATEAKPLPAGVTAPRSPYSAELPNPAARNDPADRTPDLSDAYGLGYFAKGFPFAFDPGRMQDPSGRILPQVTAWPVHCHGAVGVGRNVAPDTGTGAELYAIIGQPQRHMDRNLAVVGRVIEGMEHLSALPRGSGELGFYTDEEAALRVPILSVRLGPDMAEPPALEYLDTASESFARYVAVRANRKDAFYTVPAGGVDLCSVPVPVRRSAAAR